MFNKDELERYSRQILLIGRKGQERLKTARVLVLGAGGIGSGLLPYIASSGVGHITILENDIVEKTNLGRQVLYRDAHVGSLKGAVAVNVLEELNPNINIEWFGEPFSEFNAVKYTSSADIILEGTDDLINKFLVNDVARQQKKPALIGGIGPLQGHVATILQGEENPCYRCIFEKPPDRPDEIPSCSTEGVLSPVPGVIGAMMAQICIQYLINHKVPANLCLFDNIAWRTIKMKKNADCLLCKNQTRAKKRPR